jgi:hypothetical protein
MSQSLKILSKMKDPWKQLLSFMPAGWQEKCKELGAIQRKLRKFSGPEAILHTIMIHVLGCYSLRNTKAVAKVGGIADVSDVAVQKRLKRATEWMRWMAQEIIVKTGTYPTPSFRELAMPIRLVDATVISEPGSIGTNWRILYSFDVGSMRCAQVKITDYKTGESFRKFDIERKTLYIGDRVFYQTPGIEHVCNGGGDVLVRMTLGSTVSLYHPDGQRFGVLNHLRSLKGEAIGDWPVILKTKKKVIRGRVCAIRRSRMAAQHAQQEVTYRHQHKGERVSKTELEAAKYIFVFTTLPVEKLSAKAILEMYRERWQIELVFKRLKSILGIGHLHRKNPEAVTTWLQGKLLCALLIERLLQAAEFFSPQDEAPLQMAA